MNITDEFIDYLIDCNDRITNKDLEKAKYCLLDYLGVTYAGASVNSEVLSEMDFETGECDIIGTNIKTDTATAAFVNGYNAHTVEMDDGHRYAAIHLGSVIISAIVAVAQEKHAQGQDCSSDLILCGIVIGYEAAVRCGISMQPGHKKRGYHTTGTCGSIGAAVGIGVMLGFNREQMKGTITGAATSAAGFLEIQEDESEMKPYNIGHAAMAGVMAAKIGALGLCPPDDILGGERGVLKVMTDTFSEDKLLEKTDYLEIERIYIKPYASCRHCHPAMEAAMRIRNESNLEPQNIDRIIVDTYEFAVRGHDHTLIQGVESAKLSIPYSVAVAYITQDGGLDAFTEEKINDEEILSLTEKATVSSVDEFTQQSPEKRISEVHIFSGDKEYVSHVDYAKGEPENPMTDEEIRNKFISLMKWAGKQSQTDQILSVIENMEL